MSKPYKLPKCWLGKKMKIISDDPNKSEHVITEADVNMECRCTTEMQAFFCDDGHLTECHVGLSCQDADCSHMAKYDLQDQYIDEFEDTKEDLS